MLKSQKNIKKDKECEGNCCEPLSEDFAVYVKCYSDPTKKMRLCQKCADYLNNIGLGMPWNKK